MNHSWALRVLLGACLMLTLATCLLPGCCKFLGLRKTELLSKELMPDDLHTQEVAYHNSIRLRLPFGSLKKK
ncbi:MAG TPA: hypothetical protein PLJ27_16150, partial [Polyangiaceae bacterium]|nr:hypothetical protein [Polyangiaceae bacterium]